MTCSNCKREMWAGNYGNVCMATNSRHCNEEALTYWKARAGKLEDDLARTKAYAGKMVAMASGEVGDGP